MAKESNIIELGSCEAILSKIGTRVDGSAFVTLEINPNDEELIAKLFKAFLHGEKLLTVGFVKVVE